MPFLRYGPAAMASVFSEKGDGARVTWGGQKRRSGRGGIFSRSRVNVNTWRMLYFVFVFAKLRGMEVYERVLVGGSIVAMEEDVGVVSRNESGTTEEPWSFSGCCEYFWRSGNARRTHLIGCSGPFEN